MNSEFNLQRSAVKHLVLLLAFVLAGCTGLTTPSATAPPESVTLKLNWKHGVQFLGFYVAQEQGFYADEGLIVTIDPLLDPSKIPELPAQVVSGEFDFTTGARPVMTAQGQGVPITAIATVAQFSPLAFFAQTDTGIETLADLAGRRVIAFNEATEETLEDLLKLEGLTLADVEVVSGNFDMTPFFEGEIDVWFGFLNDEVVLARQQGLELVTFPLYEYGIYQIAVSIFTHQQTVETNPDLAVRFLRASLQGWEWALEHPTEAVDIMLARFPELAGEREFHLASFDAYIPLVRPPGTRVGTIDCQRWLSDDLLANLESTEGLCTTSILEAVWEGN